MAPPPPPKLPPLKLDDILARVRKEQHWSAAQAEEAELWYRRFLLLVFQRGGRPVYVISKKADDLWHGHIVFTRRYRADCQRIFGHYLDHTPSIPRSAKLKKQRLTRGKVLYKKAFGSTPPGPYRPCY